MILTSLEEMKHRYSVWGTSLVVMGAISILIGAA